MFSSSTLQPLSSTNPNFSPNRFFYPYVAPTLLSVSANPFPTHLDHTLRLILFTQFHQNIPRFLNHPRNSTASLPPFNDNSLIEEAQQAVSSILQESGISEAMSTDIASNSPEYVDMLMNGVRDLDEHSLWSSWSTKLELDDDIAISYKKKVYCMAKEKGDQGMLPFLESIGLSLSSSMNLARYLSSETLPSVVDKVLYVKEMFFSGSDESGFIGSNARRMMMNLSIPTDDHVQQTLSFFEKIEARRGGLNLLGTNDAAFKYLVQSFPRFLLLSLDSHLKPLVEFFEDIKVPKGCMKNTLLLFPPIMFFDIERTIKPRLMAFEKIGVADKYFGKMLVKYPWIVSTSIQENFEEILAFFNDEKVPEVYISRAIRSWPILLGSSTTKLKLMVGQFKECGVGSRKMARVIARCPQLLLRKPNEFIKVVLFFEDLGFDKEIIGRTLGRCPEIFATSIEKTLKKKIQFLTSIGVSTDHLPRIITKYPQFFVSDVDKTLHPRMNLLHNVGISKDDVAFMVRKFSPLLGYSIDGVFMPKLQFLVNTMKMPVKEVVEYPRFFSYSLEKKIKPRFFVLKGGNVEFSLKDMLSKNDEEFASEFMGI